MEGEGMVAVVRGLQNAGLAVTLLDGNRQYTLMPNSTTTPTQNHNVSNANASTQQTPQKSTADSSTEPSLQQYDSGAQAIDGRYASTYKTMHCNVRPTSPPVQLTEFPPQRPDVYPGHGNFQVGGTGSGATHSPIRATSPINFRGGLSWPDRGSVCSPRPSHEVDPFANSLRKYPNISPDRSSEIMERLINYTQTKGLSKTCTRNQSSPNRLSEPCSHHTLETKATSRCSRTYEPEITIRTRKFEEVPTRDKKKEDYHDPRFSKGYDIRCLRDMSKRLRDNVKAISTYPYSAPICPTIKESYDYQTYENTNTSSVNMEIQAAVKMISKEVATMHRDLPSRKTVAVPETTFCASEGNTEGECYIVPNLETNTSFKSIQTTFCTSEFTLGPRKSAQTVSSSVDIYSKRNRIRFMEGRKSKSQEEIKVTKEDLRRGLLELIEEVSSSTKSKKLIRDELVKKLFDTDRGDKDDNKSERGKSKRDRCHKYVSTFCPSGCDYVGDFVELVGKLKHCYGDSEQAMRTEIKPLKISEYKQLDFVLKDWINDLNIKARHKSGQNVERNEILNIVEDKIKEVFKNRTKQEFDLKLAIVKIIEGIPIEVSKSYSKKSYLHRLVDVLLKRMKNVVINQQIGKNRRKGPSNRLKRILTEDDIRDFVKEYLSDFYDDCQIEISDNTMDDLENELIDVLIDSIDCIRCGHIDDAREEMEIILQDIGKMTDKQADCITNVILQNLQGLLNNCNFNQTYMILHSNVSSKHHTNNTDVSIGAITQGDLNANLDHYTNQLTERINEWLNTLKIPEIQDKGFRDVVVNDLAGDIVDRHKYLELNPHLRGTVEDELETLKYQIFKWINKLVGEENTETIGHAQELMVKINSVPIPMLTDPQSQRALQQPFDPMRPCLGETGTNNCRTRKLCSNSSTKSQDCKFPCSLIPQVDGRHPEPKENMAQGSQASDGNYSHTAQSAQGQPETHSKSSQTSQDHLKTQTNTGQTTQVLPENYLYVDQSSQSYPEHVPGKSEDLPASYLLPAQESPQGSYKQGFTHVQVPPYDQNQSFGPASKPYGQGFENVKSNTMSHGQDLSSAHPSYGPIASGVQASPGAQSLGTVSFGPTVRPVSNPGQLQDPNEQWNRPAAFLPGPVPVSTSRNPPGVSQMPMYGNMSARFTPGRMSHPSEISGQMGPNQHTMNYSNQQSLYGAGNNTMVGPSQGAHNNSVLDSLAPEQMLGNINSSGAGMQGTSYYASPQMISSARVGDLAPDSPYQYGSTASPTSLKQLNDEYDEYLKQWIQEIPIKATTPSEKELAEKARLGIYNGIWKAITKMKLDHNVFSNPLYYQDVFDDELEALFAHLPKNPELESNKHRLKSQLLEKTVDMNELIRSTNAPASYKQQLIENIENNLPKRAGDTMNSEDPKKQNETIQKLNLAETYILYTRYKDEDNLKANVHKKNFLKNLETFLATLKSKDCTDMDINTCANEIINSLDHVPVPHMNSIRDEVDDILLGREVENWISDLPQNLDNTGPLEKRRIRDAIVKKVQELGTIVGYADTSFARPLKNELPKFLEKIPIKKGTNIDFMIEELANRIMTLSRDLRQKAVSFQETVDYEMFSMNMPASSSFAEPPEIFGQGASYSVDPSRGGRYNTSVPEEEQWHTLQETQAPSGLRNWSQGKQSSSSASRQPYVQNISGQVPAEAYFPTNYSISNAAPVHTTIPGSSGACCLVIYSNAQDYQTPSTLDSVSQLSPKGPCCSNVACLNRPRTSTQSPTGPYAPGDQSSKVFKGSYGQATPVPNQGQRFVSSPQGQVLPNIQGYQITSTLDSVSQLPPKGPCCNNVACLNRPRISTQSPTGPYAPGVQSSQVPQESYGQTNPVPYNQGQSFISTPNDQVVPNIRGSPGRKPIDITQISQGPQEAYNQGFLNVQGDPISYNPGQCTVSTTQGQVVPNIQDSPGQNSLNVTRMNQMPQPAYSQGFANVQDGSVLYNQDHTFVSPSPGQVLSNFRSSSGRKSLDTTQVSQIPQEVYSQGLPNVQSGAHAAQVSSVQPHGPYDKSLPNVENSPVSYNQVQSYGLAQAPYDQVPQVQDGSVPMSQMTSQGPNIPQISQVIQGSYSPGLPNFENSLPSHNQVQTFDPAFAPYGQVSPNIQGSIVPASQVPISSQRPNVSQMGQVSLSHGQPPHEVHGKASQGISGQPSQGTQGQGHHGQAPNGTSWQPQRSKGQVSHVIHPQAPRGTSGQASESTYGQAPHRIHGQAPQGTSGQSAERTHGLAPHGIHGQAPQGIYGQAPQGVYGQASPGIHGQALQGTFEQSPEGIHGHASQGIYGKVPQRISAQFPEVTYGQAPHGIHGQDPQGIHGQAPQETHRLAPQGIHGQAPQGIHGQAPQGIHGQAPEGSHRLAPQGIHDYASQGTSGQPQGLNGQVPHGIHGQAPQEPFGQSPEGTYGHAPHGIHGQASQESHRLASQGVYDQAPQGIHGQAPQGIHGQASQGTSGQPQGSNGQVPHGIHGQAPQEPFGQSPEGTYGHAPHGIHGQAPQESHRLAPQGVYDQVPQGIHGQAPQGIHGQAPQETPTLAPQVIHGQAPEGIHEQAPQETHRLSPRGVHDQAPQGINRQVPQRTSEQPPEGIHGLASQGIHGPALQGASGQSPEGTYGQAPRGIHGQAPQETHRLAPQGAYDQASQGIHGQASQGTSGQPQGPNGQVPHGIHGQAPQEPSGQSSEGTYGQAPHGIHGQASPETQRLPPQAVYDQAPQGIHGQAPQETHGLAPQGIHGQAPQETQELASQRIHDQVPQGPLVQYPERRYRQAPQGRGPHRQAVQGTSGQSPKGTRGHDPHGIHGQAPHKIAGQLPLGVQGQNPHGQTSQETSWQPQGTNRQAPQGTSELSPEGIHRQVPRESHGQAPPGNSWQPPQGTQEQGSQGQAPQGTSGRPQGPNEPVSHGIHGQAPQEPSGQSSEGTHGQGPHGIHGQAPQGTHGRVPRKVRGNSVRAGQSPVTPAGFRGQGNQSGQPLHPSENSQVQRSMKKPRVNQTAQSSGPVSAASQVPDLKFGSPQKPNSQQSSGGGTGIVGSNQIAGPSRQTSPQFTQPVTGARQSVSEATNTIQQPGFYKSTDSEGIKQIIDQNKNLRQPATSPTEYALTHCNCGTVHKEKPTKELKTAGKNPLNINEKQIFNIKSVQTAFSSIDIKTTKCKYCEVRSKSQEELTKKSKRQEVIKRKDLGRGDLQQNVNEWFEIHSDKVKVKLWGEKMQKLAEELKKPGGEEKLRMKIEKCLKKVPDQFSEGDDERVEFRKQLPDDIIRKLKKMYLNPSDANVNIYRMELFKYCSRFKTDNFKKVLVNWLKNLNIKKKDFLGRNVKKDDIFKYVADKLEPLVLSRPKSDTEYKSALKSNITEIINDLPIFVGSHNKEYYLNKLTEILVNDIFNIESKVPSIYIQPTIKEIKEFVKDETTFFLEKSRVAISTKRMECLETELVDVLLDLSDIADIDNYVMQEITTILKEIGKLPDYKAKYFTNILLRDYKEFFFRQKFFHEEDKTDFGRPDIYSVFQNSTDVVHSNEPISFNVYTQRVVEEIRKWLSVIIIPDKNKGLMDTVIKDLVSDIVDRRKYLLLNPHFKGTEAEEIERLKYQIFKWTNKLVGEENTAILEHAQELMERINKVPKPSLPSIDNGESPQNDGKLYIEKLTDQIYDWFHQLPVGRYFSQDTILNKQLIKNFAEDIEKVFDRKNLGLIDKKVDEWNNGVFKSKINCNDLEQLKNKIKRLPYAKVEKNPKQQKALIRFYEDIIDEWVETIPIVPKKDLFMNNRNEFVHELAVKICNIKNEFKWTPDKVLEKNLQEEISDCMKKLPLHLQTHKQNFRHNYAAKLVKHIEACCIADSIDTGLIMQTDKRCTLTEVEAATLEWLKKLPLYRNKSIQDKERLEAIMKELANKINGAISIGHSDPDEEITEHIRLLDPKQNVYVIQNTALLLKLYLKKLNILGEISQSDNAEDQFLTATIDVWLNKLSLDIKDESRVEKQKKDFIESIKLLKSAGSDNGVIKKEILTFMTTLPMDSIKKNDIKYLNEEASELIQNFGLIPVQDTTEETPPKFNEIISDAIKNWSQNLPLKLVYCPRELRSFIDDMSLVITSLLVHPEQSMTEENNRRLLREIIKFLRRFPLQEELSTEKNISRMAEELAEILKDRYLFRKNNNTIDAKNVTVYGVSIKNISTTDYDLDRHDNEINANLKIYTKQLIQQITEWFEKLNFTNVQEEGFTEVVISDLAGDIVDRYKYLELNPESRGTNEAELEHLKYQIFKWINKLVGEDNLETIDHADDLMQRIQRIPVPMLVRPQEIGQTLPPSFGDHQKHAKYAKVQHKPSTWQEINALRGYSTPTDRDKPTPCCPLKKNCGSAGFINGPVTVQQMNALPSYGPPTGGGSFGATSQPLTSNRMSSPTALNSPNVKYTQEPSPSSPPTPHEGTKEAVYDKYQKIFKYKCDELPIDTSTPENAQLAQLAKTSIYNGIVKTFFKLKADPDIENDYGYFEFMLEEKIEEMLDVLPQSNDLINSRHAWKVAIIANAIDMLDELHGLTDRPSFRQRVRNKFNRKFARDLELEQCFLLQQGFLAEMADAYILETKYKEEDPTKANIYKHRLMKKIDDLANHLSKDHNVGFRFFKKPQLARIAMKVLEQVPIPNDDILKDEAEEILLADEVEKWYKELPTKPFVNDTDGVLRKRMMDLLAKKLYDIEKHMKDEDPSKETEMKHEISQFLEKRAKLQDDQDLNINFMVDELNNRLKNRWLKDPSNYTAFEKDKPLSSTFAQVNNHDFLAPLMDAATSTSPTQGKVYEERIDQASPRDQCSVFQACQVEPRQVYVSQPESPMQNIGQVQSPQRATPYITQGYISHPIQGMGQANSVPISNNYANNLTKSQLGSREGYIPHQDVRPYSTSSSHRPYGTGLNTSQVGPSTGYVSQQSPHMHNNFGASQFGPSDGYMSQQSPPMQSVPQVVTSPRSTHGSHFQTSQVGHSYIAQQSLPRPDIVPVHSSQRRSSYGIHVGGSQNGPDQNYVSQQVPPVQSMAHSSFNNMRGVLRTSQVASARVSNNLSVQRGETSHVGPTHESVLDPNMLNPYGAHGSNYSSQGQSPMTLPGYEGRQGPTPSQGAVSTAQVESGTSNERIREDDRDYLRCRCLEAYRRRRRYLKEYDNRSCLRYRPYTCYY